MPVALPVDVVFVSSNFLVLLLLSFCCHVTITDTSFSLPVYGSSRIKDVFFPDLVQSWEVLHVNSGLILLARALCLVLRCS